MAEKLTLTGFRNETWNPTIEYAYSGAELPLEGASIRLQWRLHPGAGGEPIIDLPADGSLTFEDSEATEQEIARGEAPRGGRFLRIYPVISVETLKTLPTGLNAPEPGEADLYSWDVVFTLPNGSTWTAIAGDVLLSPGVTEDA